MWLSKRSVLAKYGEKSYSRCTSRRGRNSALKIIRIGLEKPVAVYSICGVSPRRPQSQVGPMRVSRPARRRAATAPAVSAAGRCPSARCRASRRCRPAPARSPAPSRRPGSDTPAAAGRVSCCVSGSSSLRNNVGNKPEEHARRRQQPHAQQHGGRRLRAPAPRARCAAGPGT